ncbi:MAG: CDP-diacylglycerol--glycerol-3-phosphate 3-phosphatidyltransferase [Candidatus Binatia bacterium]
MIGTHMWTLPNLLSLFRIAIIPVLVYLLTFTDPLYSAAAAMLFLVASVTDYFDGYLARRTQAVSDLGKILDPLADKLIIVAVLIMLAAMDRPDGEVVPGWLVVVIVGRETAVTILRGIALKDGIVIEAEVLGKYKFILQASAVFGLILHYPYFGIDFYVAGMYFLVIATVIALWSAVNYHVDFFRSIHLRSSPGRA